MLYVRLLIHIEHSIFQKLIWNCNFNYIYQQEKKTQRKAQFFLILFLKWDYKQKIDCINCNLILSGQGFEDTLYNQIKSGSSIEIKALKHSQFWKNKYVLREHSTFNFIKRNIHLIAQMLNHFNHPTICNKYIKRNNIKILLSILMMPTT